MTSNALSMSVDDQTCGTGAGGTIRRRSWPIVTAGFLAGTTWGVIARGWMRWVSTDPEFSWGGTLFIVGAFAVFGSLQAGALASRRRGRRRPALTIARAGGVIGMLPLFAGAGALMLPTVVAGGLAAWRTTWRPRTRTIFGSVGCLPIVLVTTSTGSDFGILGALPRVLGLLVLYGAVVAATGSTLRPQQDGWRAPRAVRAVGGIGAVLLLVVLSIGLIGLR